jgi:uncharacterized protein YdcH (DUF465 family)
MTEHTPTPWVAEPEYEDGNPTYIHKDGHGIADCSMGYGVEDDANAAYIVKCCNAFPDLVKALEQSYASFERLAAEFDKSGDSVNFALCSRDASMTAQALGRVKGRSNPDE